MAEKGKKDDFYEKRVRVDTFEWLRNENAAKRKTRQTLAEIVEHGMPRRHLISYVEQEIAESESCMSMPFAVVLMFSYALSAIIHEDAPRVSSVEYSLKLYLEDAPRFAHSSPDMAHKGLHDVNSAIDFWSWLSLGFVPTVMDYEYTWVGGSNRSNTSETTTTTPASTDPGDGIPNDSLDGVLMNYNRIIGGVRLRQELSGLSQEEDWAEVADMEASLYPQMSTDTTSTTGNPLRVESTTWAPPEEPGKDFGDCDTREELLPVYGKKCVGGFGYELDPEKFDIRAFSNPRREKWLYVHQSIEEMQRELLQMEVSGWIDDHTRRVELSIPQYNGEYGLYTMTTINFFFSRGGHIWKAVDSLSTYANWYPYYSYVVVDLVFMGCLLEIIVQEFREIRTLMKHEGFWSLFYAYANLWNVVDWISVLFGCILAVLLQVNLGNTRWLNEEAENLSSINHEPGTAPWIMQLQTFMAALDQELMYCNSYRMFMALYPCVVIMRLFKAYSAQQRLAVITRTLYTALPDLLHFFVVTMPIFASYTISAVTLMGRDVETFTTFSRCTNQLFRALQGDLDWQQIAETGRYKAAGWFFFFQVLLTLVLFNILISILMDAYEQVQSSTKGAEMMWEELRQELRMRIGLWQKKLVPLKLVSKSLKKDASLMTTANLWPHRTKPESADTNWLVVHNEQTGQVTFECSLKQSTSGVFHGPAETFLSSDEFPAMGTVIVLDGMGGVKVLRKGDPPAAFSVKLDDHGVFQWYDAQTKSEISGAEKFTDEELLEAVREAGKPDSKADMVTAAHLEKLVKGIRYKQACDILKNALTDYYKTYNKHEGLEELREYMQHAYHRSGKFMKAALGAPKPQKRKKAISVELNLQTRDIIREMRSGEDDDEQPQVCTERRMQQYKKEQDERRKKHLALPPMMGDQLRSMKSKVDKGFVDLCILGDSDEMAAGRKSSDDESDRVPLGARRSHAYRRPQLVVDQTEVFSIDELHVGARVRVSRDLRVVLGACHEAGLAAENAIWRKRVAGKKGSIIRVDPQDMTAQIGVDDLGCELWIAIAALRKPLYIDGEEVDEVQMRRRTEERKKNRNVQRTQQKEFMKSKESHVRKLQDKVAEVHGAVQEALDTAAELRKRLVKQLERKTRLELELHQLQAQRDGLAKKNRIAGQAVRGGWDEVKGINATRTQYLDTMNELEKENDALQWEIEDERQRFDVHKEEVQADIEHLKQHHEDLQRDLEVLHAHQKKARANSSYFAWLAGKADKVAREADLEDHIAHFVPDMCAIRDLALQVERSFEGRPQRDLQRASSSRLSSPRRHSSGRSASPRKRGRRIDSSVRF